MTIKQHIQGIRKANEKVLSARTGETILAAHKVFSDRAWAFARLDETYDWSSLSKEEIEEVIKITDLLTMAFNIIENDLELDDYIDRILAKIEEAK